VILRAAPLLTLAALAIPGGPAGGAAPAEQIVVENGGDLFAISPGDARRTQLTSGTPADSAPALAPDGTRVAFVSDGTGSTEIGLLDLRGRRTDRLTSNPGRVDTEPAWSPDAKLIAYASAAAGEGFDLYVTAVDGSGKRRLVADPADERQPAWSPDGRRVVFASNRTGTYDLWAVDSGGGSEPERLTQEPGDELFPAWSPDGGRIAYAGGGLHVLELASRAVSTLSPDAGAAAPDWSPAGDRIVFATGQPGASLVQTIPASGGAAVPLPGGRPGDAHPSWGPAAPSPPPPPRPRPRKPKPRPAPKPERPDPLELLPDLDQRAPSGLTVDGSGGRFKLGFTSATDNVGRGPVWIRARRPNRGTPLMRADQLIPLRNGRVRVVRGVGVSRYTYSSSHSHWHLLRFQTFELRRANDFRVVARDRKSGFCLADHYGLARDRVRGFGPPHFLGNCGRGRPDLLSVEQGTSIGYTDRYPAHFHGQNVEITGLPPGRYVLVHRANSSGRLHELTLRNNAASLVLQLSWPLGRHAAPHIRVLAVCEGSERCPRSLVSSTRAATSR
jgi:hypothetical protein